MWKNFFKYKLQESLSGRTLNSAALCSATSGSSPETQSKPLPRSFEDIVVVPQTDASFSTS